MIFLQLLKRQNPAKKFETSIQKKPSKSKTHPHDNNVEEQDKYIFVIDQEEPFKYNLCRCNCMYIESIHVHMKTTHGSKWRWGLTVDLHLYKTHELGKCVIKFLHYHFTLTTYQLR